METGRTIVKVFMSLFLVAGALFVYCALFDSPTPERELTLVEGVPRDVSLEWTGSARRGGSGQDQLKFRVGQYLMQIRMNKYGENALPAIRAAARSGAPVKIWVNAKTVVGHLMYGRDFAELYQLAVGNDQIITYQDTVAKFKKSNEDSTPLALVFIILGLSLALWLKLTKF
jgi:hypothetical protein